jgi:hypothetical protein
MWGNELMEGKLIITNWLAETGKFSKSETENWKKPEN